MRLGFAAADLYRATLGMFALLLGQAEAIAEETFHQNNDITAVGRPHTGFVEGEGDMMVGAAFTATDAGKMSVHGGSVTRQGQRARWNGDGFLPLSTELALWKQVVRQGLSVLLHYIP